jgi:hypothetical protein
MYRQARPLRQEQEHQDWKDYARRMIWYAFGAAGDIDVAAFKPTQEVIQKFHDEAVELEARQKEAALDAQRREEEQKPRPRMSMR